MAKTPRYGHAPIEMRCFPKDGFWDRPDIRAGDFYWVVEKGKRRLWVMIPCGPNGRRLERGIVSEWTIDHRNSCGAQWRMEGSEEKPTLHPSLHAVGVWHGWVRDGQLVEA